MGVLHIIQNNRIGTSPSDAVVMPRRGSHTLQLRCSERILQPQLTGHHNFDDLINDIFRINLLFVHSKMVTSIPIQY